MSNGLIHKECLVAKEALRSNAALFAMIKRGAFPRPIYASPGRRFWFASDVARWQAALREHDHFNPERPRRGGRRKANVISGAISQ